MRSPSPRVTSSVRALSSALLVLALSLTFAPAAPAAAGPPTGPPTTSPLSARDGAPGADADFPRLPGRCYDRSTGQVVSPCRITYAGPRRPWVVVWGDSHAWMYAGALTQLADRYRVNLLTMFYGSCPVSVPFPASSGEPRYACDDHNDRALRTVRQLVAQGRTVRVVVGGYWAGYRHNFELVRRKERTGRPTGLSTYHEHMAKLAVRRSGAAAQGLARLGVPVDFIAPAATVPTDARRCPAGRIPYQCNLPRTRALPQERRNLAFVRSLSARITAPSRVINPTSLYCWPRTCRAHVDGVDTFYDTVHLGDRLARKTKPWFRPTFRLVTSRRR